MQALFLPLPMPHRQLAAPLSHCLLRPCSAKLIARINLQSAYFGASETQTKEADCPCIEWHSMRNRTSKKVSCFLGFPRPALLRQIHIPDAGINVYLFTYC